MVQLYRLLGNYRVYLSGALIFLMFVYLSTQFVGSPPSNNEKILFSGKTSKYSDRKIQDIFKGIGQRINHDVRNSDDTVEMSAGNNEEDSVNNEIPVYVVDEHHEVIPYWFSAIDEGYVKRHKNILIHIDGHSDMAPPEDFEPLKRFKYSKGQAKKSFFPLMQSNDVFIQSAIYHELIDYVVWVRPSWTRNHYQTQFVKSYVGITKDNATDRERFCSCEKETRSGNNGETECAYIPSDSKDREEIDIPPSLCKQTKAFKYITISEMKLLDHLTLKKGGNIIVDIDEDYFGVESGVQKFIDLYGIHMETLKDINDFFSDLFDVTTNIDEMELSEKIRDFFKTILKKGYKRVEDTNEKEAFIRKQWLGLKKYFKDDYPEFENITNAFIEYASKLSEKDTKALSKLPYCLDGTPGMSNIQNNDFKICHGNLFPDDELNQFYTSDIKEIEERGDKLTDILSFISSHSLPQIFTLCRSLRDGYTPRYLQTIIEKRILTSIQTALNKFDKAPTVVYDDYLLNGKAGWKNKIRGQD